MVVRLAEEEDIPRIRKLQATIIPAAFGNGKRGKDFLAWRCTTEEWITTKEGYIRNLILGEKSTVHVAEVNGVIRGFSYTDHNEVAGNFVEGLWRRRRIGLALMAQELDAMVRWGYSDAWLGVADFAEGPQCFYSDCGFAIHSREIMDLPPGHNGRATGTEFAVKDLKMELTDTVKARDDLQARLGLGAVAFTETIMIDLKPFNQICFLTRCLISKLLRRLSTLAVCLKDARNLVLLFRRGLYS